MLRLNTLILFIHRGSGSYANTTNVKVKYTNPQEDNSRNQDSNTTNVKVKF